jgi:hypothetical protein
MAPRPPFFIYEKRLPTTHGRRVPAQLVRGYLLAGNDLNIMNKSIMRILTSLIITCMAVGASAQETSVTLSVDGKPALLLQVPSAARITSSNAYVNIRTTKMSLHVWAVPNARTVEEAVPRAGDLIKGEFVKFKPSTITDVDIAGAPAKHIIGPGNEADDGDPGNAEVVLFVVGGRVFAGCVHGEFDDASRARPAMMAVLQTAHAPP